MQVVGILLFPFLNFILSNFHCNTIQSTRSIAVMLMIVLKFHELPLFCAVPLILLIWIHVFIIIMSTKYSLPGTVMATIYGRDFSRWRGRKKGKFICTIKITREEIVSPMQRIFYWTGLTMRTCILRSKQSKNAHSWHFIKCINRIYSLWKNYFMKRYSISLMWEEGREFLEVYHVDCWVQAKVLII